MEYLWNRRAYLWPIIVGWHMEYGCAAMRLALSVWPNPTAHIDGTNGHMHHCIIWMTHIDTPAHLNAGTRLATIPSTHAAGLTPLVGSHWHLTHNGTWVWDNTQSNQPMAHLHTETIYIMIPICTDCEDCIAKPHPTSQVLQPTWYQK